MNDEFVLLPPRKGSHDKQRITYPTEYNIHVRILAVLTLLPSLLIAEDGYRLWLRAPIPATPADITVEGVSPTAKLTRQELTAALPSGLTVIAGTPANSPQIARLKLPVARSGRDGFLIRNVTVNKRAVIAIASSSEIGVLCGAFHLLRLLAAGATPASINTVERPRYELRMLNHWDNLNGTIERGYAGRSLWQWDQLPDTLDPRLTDYARANASVGINATVLNNVNANSRSLSPEYIAKTAAVANVFRPFGLRVFLSARFSAPIELGGLKTADPLDPAVAAWWKNKVDEIYKSIPDFGGFLVKANSEGQPGPRTYNRSHKDGANMLAAALAPHQGIVVWRAFVYDVKEGYDRAAAAYDNLQPFDGQFAPNVLLQVKNGPIDFQPREPYHPLFGAMPKTRLIAELQITQEYLGQSNNLAFLAPSWREMFTADTYSKGKGTPVSKVIAGVAGVANTGSDRNWTGHDMAQANWYAFGRMAWNPDLDPKNIAAEWARQTFTTNAHAADAIAQILTTSHQAVVDYMTPLGLNHIMWGGHHYGPAPWWSREPRADWNPPYFHRADDTGLGFDRTAKGSNALAQYPPQVSKLLGKLETCPEDLLTWFHHVPWDHRMKSGRIFWDEFALRYQRGVDWTRQARKQWASLAAMVDPERHAAIAAKLAIQERDAVVWRDSCLLYFQGFSKRPLPDGVEKPAHPFDVYKSRTLLDWSLN